MEPAKQNIRIQTWVAALSVVLLITKLVAYFLTGSVAILTDALEGIVNVVAGFFGLYSLYLSAKPRDEDHPYGHGKIEFVSAAVEGTMIVIAGIVIFYTAFTHLFDPKPLQELDFGILLIGTTAILNFVAGRICIRMGTKNNSLALVASGKHLTSDTYSTIGVLIGLAIIYFTNILWLDSAVAILFSFVILYTGYKIVRTSVAGIMDESDRALLKKMVKVLNENRRENWMDLHNVRIIKYGSTLHLDAHLTVPWYFNVHEAHNEIDELALLVRKDFGESLELFVHSDGCLEFQCRICSKHDCPVRQHPLEKKITWTVDNISSNQKHNTSTSE
ncbi:MAG TPA: cation diffusion facilitator family transporter [Cyclobacteriaceae bacterium]|nr:cation diffusion facilitator family transporter [Cyclobacteriaceae bacterium]HMV89912.1 cation diffusion facilitator family transporter [Cyclobacteriaceae bacterium]HMX02579.1 cation diffusion facilitator family transporter [Cyclobacteriaceae bacterium]HMX50922.1 cation diffusion facilitator family transporter [Cyclobacteriaceae bacterium]HMY92198.1 cation diffusion facilitator family transporter [Cyclobacteriaceae bacterium]